MKNPNLKYKAILGLLFLLSIFVRFFGIDFGLPHTECRPDETTIINISLTFLNGDLNPHFFNYPSLFMYILAAIYYIYIHIRLLFGATSMELITEIQTNPSTFILISRGLSALFGACTVIIVYFIGRRLHNRKTGLLSAFFMSVCYLHVRDSHFGTTDIAMTFFVVCAILYILKSYEESKTGHYILAGVFCGLSTSTKYGGLLLIIPMTVAHIMKCTRESQCTSPQSKMIQTRQNLQSIFSSLWNRLLGVLSISIKSMKGNRLLLYYLFFGLAFFLFTPFALLDFQNFIGDFRAEMKHLLFGHRGIILGRGWWYHLRHTLPYGMGWLMLIASFLGIVLYSKKYFPKSLIFFLFPAIYYFSAGRGYTVFLRYMIPVLPFLCIASAMFVVYIIKRSNNRTFQKIAIPLTALILTAEPVRNVIHFNNIIIKKDNRLIVGQWMEESIPLGSRIYQTGSKYSRLQSIAGLPADIYYSEFRTPGVHFVTRTLEENNLPDYILVQQSPLKAYDRVPDKLLQRIQTDYRLIKTFIAVNPDSKSNWYDQLDAFYIPFTGFEDLTRPGPNIYIYQLTDTYRQNKLLHAAKIR